MEKTLSLADVARYPRPGMRIPRGVAFTPDSRQVLSLLSAEGTLVQDLWVHDIASGARHRIAAPAGSGESGARPLEEALRRERTRVRELGITEYQCARAGADGPILVLVPVGDALYLSRDLQALTRLEGTQGASSAQLSPDGAHLAFVRAGDLWVMETGGDAAHRLTAGAEDGITNGLAEYIAQEEMGRQQGFWWSPDGARLAFVRADSRHIPIYPIVHQGTEAIAVEEHRYPFAGGRNATVRLGVTPVDGGPEDTVWMDLGADEDIYLARVAWRPDGVLTATLQSRDQRTLKLVAFAPGGEASTLIEERGEPWLNLSDDTRFLRSGEILWSSEKTGFRHLYLHDPDGREVRALTAGAWMVTGGVAVDEERRRVYFQATADGVTERHLYAVSLDGGAPRRLTLERGWHEAAIAPDGRWYVDTWSSVEHPPRVTLRALSDDAAPVTLLEDAGPTPDSLGLCVPELLRITARDGTELHAALYATAAARAAGEPRPLVVSVYGGPHAQRVTDHWDLTVDLRAQYLAQHGYVVLKVDNRGSANRGLAFEAAIAGRFGHVEVEDQVDGVRALAERPYVDSARVGIYGWSYGGYMTCRALLLAPTVFTVGVAGAPVTFWEGYDTHYTERYMGQPAAHADAYRASAVLPHAGSLEDHLLLIHGLVDENVHARHTLRLAAALAAAGKPYALVVFPEERHMPRDPAGLEYLERCLVDFMDRHLASGE